MMMKNNIMLGYANYSEEIDYFGYMKNDINSSQYNNDKKRIYAYSWSYGQRGS